MGLNRAANQGPSDAADHAADYRAEGPALLLLNRQAGRARPAHRQAVLAALHGAVRVVETGSAAETTALARQAGAVLVLAGGGDGTVAAVANGLSEGATLGVVPLGTANVFAHELALPFTPQGIAASLRARRTVSVWPGLATTQAGPRLFLQMAGLGFDAELVHTLPAALKQRWGRWAYVLHMLRLLPRHNFPPFTVLLDGVAHRAANLVVCKGRFYGGRFLLAPQADPTRAGFIVALSSGRAATTLLHAMALPAGMLPRMPGLQLLRAGTIQVSASHRLQMDGDAAGNSPLHITDIGPINVLVAE